MVTKILVAFHSRNGSVETLARALAQGAEQAGAEVRLRRAREFVPASTMAMAPGWAENAERMNGLYEAPSAADAEWADGIAFGAPTRFGAMATELRAYIDSLGALWFQGKLYGKAGAAFTSTSTLHGGVESTLLSIYPTFAHLGMIIVPPGYGDPVMFRAGAPYGAASVSHGAQALGPTEDDTAVARFLGRRLAETATRLSRPL
jgi:NAD(P)H dehydrogenase (quinone)